ncbi:protein of unknown function (DUF4279) [Apibacter mensalis]|uniref:DUF4279 domain-containing protein n=1 Tax=Apibacter mensalis TaxID=1586267 RepID=A0A0X3AM02_9FLAO|nr:DUF4279 domain-containing protein [Apibacter mensalis]CVK16209.1 protein of unknown function (DUF4279) [Apibacter mensalis]
MYKLDLNELYFEFIIRGYNDITHEDITRMLNIKPSKIYIKGKPMNPKMKILAKENGWRLNNPLANKSLFEDQLNAMLDLLEPKIEILQMLSKKYGCEYEFSLAIFIYNRKESTPWVHLTPRYNEFIRQLEVEFDLDLYCPPDDEEMSETE